MCKLQEKIEEEIKRIEKEHFEYTDGGTMIYFIGKKNDEFLDDDIEKSLTSIALYVMDEMMLEKKNFPPNIKQEIWGGECGYPNTIIENPDVFGIENVSGYNQAVQDLDQKRTELKKSLN